MTPLPRVTRKRTIEDVDSDPCRFLTTYFQERGIPESPEEDAPLLKDCVARADGARDSFKRWRGGNSTADADPNKPTPALSSGEKYKRRLVNNRRSAAAARVYQEVLRREHTHALRKAAAERDSLASDVQQLNEALDSMRKENARLTNLEQAKKKRKLVKKEVIKDESDACEAQEVSVGSGDAASSDEEDASEVASDEGGDVVAVPAATEASAKVYALPFADISGLSTTPSSMTTSRALVSIFGSQGSNQGASQDHLALPAISPPAPFIAPAAPLCIFGQLNSQLSVGLAGCLQPTPPSAPNTDDFTDASQLFAFSQGFASQPLNQASQPLASQSG